MSEIVNLGAVSVVSLDSPELFGLWNNIEHRPVEPDELDDILSELSEEQQELLELYILVR